MEKSLGPVLLATAGHSGVKMGDVEFWIAATLAPDWYLDAAREAQSQDGLASLRREIAFSVALAETYLFEWVRDDVLRGQHQELERVIRSEDWRQPVEKKWKLIPKVLHRRGLLRAAFDAGTSRAWPDFTRLVDYRNGLLHGGASWPQSDKRERKPRPLHGELAQLAPDWPLNVVRRLIVELHATVGTAPPDWLK